MTLENRLSVINGYAEWMDELLTRGREGEDDIWYGNLVTLMFDHISGDFERRKAVMFDETERVYSTLVPHLVRHPKSKSGHAKLPIAVFALDLPGKKTSERSSQAILRDVNINGGLHVHGLVLIRTDTRLRRTLNMHMAEDSKYYPEYVRDDRPLREIQVEPIRSFPDEVTDYALKSLKWKLPDLDNILVLPKDSGRWRKLADDALNRSPHRDVA